jgi:hypothetical protein
MRAGLAQYHRGAPAGLGVEHLVKINTFLTDKVRSVPNRAFRRKMLQGNEPASTVMIAETVDGKCCWRSRRLLLSERAAG